MELPLNIFLSILVLCSLLLSCTPKDVEMQPEIEPSVSPLTCAQLCKQQEGYVASRCAGAALGPNPESVCLSSEVSVGETSDCTIYDKDGKPLLGAIKDCCCTISR